MRRKGASAFLYLIFGVLIMVFVVNFGPQGGQGGCGGVTNAVLEVDGKDSNLIAYRVAYSNPFNPLRSRERTYFALETLVRREILAQAAEERGIRVTGDMVDEEIKKGNFFIGGLRVPLGENIFEVHEDGTQTWSVRKFKGWVAALDVKSTSSYRDEQIRSMQAAMMFDILSSGARVSREEALTDYLFAKNTITYDTVEFSPVAYRDAMRLTDADIQRFLATHEAEVKAKYAADERTYKAVKPQLKLRQIVIATAEPAAAPADAAKKPAGLSADAAKAKLESARTAIAAGKQKFADAAKQLSTDEASKANGGELGWRSVENAQLGDQALNDAVKTLKPGEMTPVITTDAGAVLVMAEEAREGDLGYDQVKTEIAAELARDTWSKEAAKRAAIAALEQASSGTGKNLEQLFERAAASPGGIDFNDPNMTEEQKQMIMEQLRQQMGTQGSIEIESADVPVAWKAAPDETGGSAEAAPATAAPTAPRVMKVDRKALEAAAGGAATGSAAPAAGSAAPAAGSDAPAAGSAAPAAGSVAPVPPPAPATTVVTPTTDVLPAFGEIAKPNVVRQGPTPRQPVLPGVGKDATAVLFDELSQGMLGKQVHEVNGSYVVFQLINKAQPKVEDFDKDADLYVSRLQTVRQYALVEDWMETRCKELTKADKIKPSTELIAETDDKGNPLPRVYQPCMYGSQWLSAMLPRPGR